MIDELSECRAVLARHDRACEEKKGIIPHSLLRKAAVGGGCRACPAV